MKKIFALLLVSLVFATVSMSQAVRDRNVIPVAVNLNQVLRMTIYDGGNIEFVFNTIDDYRFGLSGDAATSASANDATSDPFYVSSFTIASSTEWDLNYGAENATFIGVDDPANTLALDNVGYSFTNNGTHAFGTELISTPTTDNTVIADLDVFPTNDFIGWDNGGASNAGDATDNDFTIVWRCGTAEDDMNAVVLLEQTGIVPDRYVVNVLFELAISDN